MLDRHKPEAVQRLSRDSLSVLGETDWNSAVKSLAPPLDPKISFAAWNLTIRAWLGLSTLCLRGKRTHRPPYGWNRRKDKIPDSLKFRFFTFSELTDVYFLVLLDFLSGAGVERIDRFATVVNVISEMKLSPRLREVVEPLHDGFFGDRDCGHSAVQKRQDRTRKFLLDQGFSHIRVDLLTGKIRLCPVPSDISPGAALSFNNQTGNEVCPEIIEQRWRALFGRPEFLEIALDERVNAFHNSALNAKNNLTVKRQSNSNAPKHGVIVMPTLSDLLVSAGAIP